MADHNLSRIVDVSGDNWNIKAKGLESQRTISLTGDVTGSVTTDLSGDASISTDIGNGKVGTNELADSAVTNAKLGDRAVTLDKIDDTAKGTNIGAADGKLATQAAVKTYVDAAVAGGSHYLGQKTVAQINALTGLNNSDHVRCLDAGTITDGGLVVRAGEDIIYYKDGSTHHWDSMDGDFKLKQTAVSKSGGVGKTITALSQNTNGEIDATFNDISITESQVTNLTTHLNAKAAAADLTSHVNNTSNPHSVTKAQVGLGNVDNKSEATIKSDFTGAVASGNTGFPTGGAVFTALSQKEGTFEINYKASENALVFHKTFGTET